MTIDPPRIPTIPGRNHAGAFTDQAAGRVNPSQQLERRQPNVTFTHVGHMICVICVILCDLFPLHLHLLGRVDTLLICMIQRMSMGGNRTFY